jgi:hypothetical protein
MTTIDATTGTITTVRGDTFVLDFETVQIDGTDIVWGVSDSAKLTVRATANSASTVINATSDAEIDITTDGKMSIAIANTVMALITPATYVYDLEVTLSGNVHTWINKKQFIVLEDVAR